MIWSDLDIGYIAGLLEGEGCFSLRLQGSPRVVIGMTDEDTILKIPALLGIGYVSGPYCKGQGRKDVWEWHVGGYKAVARLLLAVYPLMSKRRQQKIYEVVDILKQRSSPINCEGCNGIIRFQDRLKKNKRYCSRPCNMRHYMKEKRAREIKNNFKICQICNEFFIRDGKRIYCTKKCVMEAKNKSRRSG